MAQNETKGSRFELHGVTVTEKTRDLPVSGRYDVLVGGGGVAGVLAAIAAARNGAKTLLLERFGFLGGVATAGLMHMAYAPYRTTSGITQEMYAKMIEMGSGIDDVLMPFDAEHYKSVALNMAMQAGVELLFHTVIADTLVDADRVKGLVVENKSGRSALLSHAIVDATGDGDICARAGARFVMGREQDGKMRPVTLLFRMGGIRVAELLGYVADHPDQFSKDPYKNVLLPEKGFFRILGFFDLIQEAKKRGELDPGLHYVRLECLSPETGVAMINSTRIYDMDGTRAQDLTRSEITARQQMMQLVSVFRKRFPGFQKSFLIDSAPMLGVRETRHIRGDYVLTEADIASRRRFDRVVARNAVRIAPGKDVHSPDGMEGSPMDSRHRDFIDALFWHGIPYDCLLPSGVEGLLTAGRCISASHEADKWIRVQTCCMATGQAAGTAAALAVKDDTRPRALDVFKLQQRLRDQSVILEYGAG